MPIPLSPLPPIQRLAWLTEHQTLRCRASIPGLFLADQEYHLLLDTATAETEEERRRFDGRIETVGITGTELAVKLLDETGEWHAFSLYGGSGAANPHDRHHSLDLLLQHFDIPDIPDVARVFPDRYTAYREKLKTLPCSKP